MNPVVYPPLLRALLVTVLLCAFLANVSSHPQRNLHSRSLNVEPLTEGIQHIQRPIREVADKKEHHGIGGFDIMFHLHKVLGKKPDA